MAVANRPLVIALRMFITAVLPRPFETRPAVEDLVRSPMRLSGVSGDEHHVLRECQKFYSLLNWCKWSLRKKRRCQAEAGTASSKQLLPAPTADRPRADPLAVQDVLGDPDLLLTTGVLRGTRAAVGTPGAHRELQAAVVAITCCGPPVATRLARRDGIPVNAVRIGGTGRQRHRRHSERACDGGQTKRPADVPHFDPFAKRAPSTPARTRGRSCLYTGEGVGPHRLGQVRQRKARDASPGTGPAAVESGNPPSGSVSAPTHTQVLGFEIILLRLKLFGPYKAIGAKSYRVKGVSRLDHGKVTTEPENRLCRSAKGLTGVRNPQLRRVIVTQITVFL
jgi:hypothetical protein